MHKHFRIIGISELMKNHGVSDIHTGVEGIWRKLQSLYNLEGLDERVLNQSHPPDLPSFLLSTLLGLLATLLTPAHPQEDLEEDGSPDPGAEFTLPDEDFGTLMHARRLDPNSTDSPVRLSTFTFTPAPRGKKGRAMRSVSADGSRTARTSSIIADDTEDGMAHFYLIFTFLYLSFPIARPTTVY
jgi:MRG-binding protein